MSNDMPKHYDVEHHHFSMQGSGHVENHEKQSSKIHHFFHTKELYRSHHDKQIAGVCGGLADYYGISSLIIRILFVLLVFIEGFGIILYFLGWLFIPFNPNQKAMHSTHVEKVTNHIATQKNVDKFFLVGIILLIIFIMLLVINIIYKVVFAAYIKYIVIGLIIIFFLMNKKKIINSE